MNIDPNTVVHIDKLAFEGKGIGKLENNKKCLIKKTIPGDEVKFRIMKKGRGYFEGWPTEFVKHSPDKCKPACPLFYECGGCSFQQLPYEKQLFWKQKFLDESLERIGGFSKEEIEKWKKPIIGAEKKLEYRNKTEFSFRSEPINGFLEEKPTEPRDPDEEKVLTVGFYNPQWRFHVIKVDSCKLQSKNAEKALSALQEIVKESKLDVFVPKLRNFEGNTEGFLFSCTVRSNHKDEILIGINTNDTDFPKEEKERWIEIFKSHIGDDLKGILQIKKHRQESASEEIVVNLWGESEMEEQVKDLKFQLGIKSFFQVNREMAGQIIDILREEIATIPERKNLLDLFCGNGFLGISVANTVETVTGIELNPFAVKEGEQNLKLNNLKNYSFYEGDASKVLQIFLEEEKRSFDIVILDPPRGGLGRKSCKIVNKAEAKEMIYISCNPTTLARDLAYFKELGYDIISTQVLDLFPQTYHLETVVRLSRV